MSPDRDEALRRLYREHVSAVFAFFSYSLAREPAEDLTSTTFERAIRAWNRYDAKRASERTWLMAIARNALTDHYRRQRFRRSASLDEQPALLESLAATDDPAETAMSAISLVDRLSTLSSRERTVIAMRFGADMSARDVGRILSMSEANVHQVTSRALRSLRAQETPQDT